MSVQPIAPHTTTAAAASGAAVLLLAILRVRLSPWPRAAAASRAMEAALELR